MYKKISKLFVAILLALSVFTGIHITKANTAKVRAVSIDAGRKYFSKDQLKEIISAMSEKQYTHLHLLVGNDGLRFLLNDMSLSVEGQSYDSQRVKDAIHQGNVEYFRHKNVEDTENNRELTETEMDEIFEFARTKNIEIIPGLNSPGHMDAILTAMEQLGMSNVRYRNSKTTLTFESQEAVKFTQELTKKYVKYFASKGSKVFNFGADEYAMDLGSAGGFTGLHRARKYNTNDGFVGYVNTMAQIIKAERMRPMVFNDGIYYYGDHGFYGTTYAPQTPFDTDILISYWIGGYSGYDVASASFLRRKGFEILNTNDKWYYVIGLNNASDAGNNPYYYDKAMERVGTAKFAEISRKSNHSNVDTIGSMVAIWADQPGKTYEFNKLQALVNKFADENVAEFGSGRPEIRMPQFAEATPSSEGGSGTSAPQTVQEEKMRVFSLDAGRKYFSKDDIKQIITKLAELKYTDLHLLFGNDGFRFLLDDLSVEVDGQQYSHVQVKNAIEAGNNEYSNRKSIPSDQNRYLTQEEMDEILVHASGQNIRVIPGFNSPGHMDALVTAISRLGIDNAKFAYGGRQSRTTVSLTNATALNFTKALFQKYVNYFKTKKDLGIEIFNFGADEYGQDITYHVNKGPSGFKAMQQLGQYDAFATYVNELATIVKTAGFKPMAFNDGFYYDNQTPSVNFDPEIIISYWTSGFERYAPASARSLHDKGFKILNTNDAWYYVLGREYSGWYSLANAKRHMGQENHKFDRVVGDNTNVPTIGSMLAIWADEPSRRFQHRHLNDLLQTFKNQNQTVFVDKPVVPGKAVYIDYLLQGSTDTVKDATVLKAEGTGVGLRYGHTPEQVISNNQGLQFELVKTEGTNEPVLAEGSAPLAGKVTDAEQRIKLYYKVKVGKSVKVRFVNEQDQEIDTEIVLHQDGVQAGTRYVADSKIEIRHNNILYRNPRVKREGASESGMVSDQEQVVTFVYSTVPGAAVKVRLVNSETQEDLQPMYNASNEGMPVGTTYNVNVEEEITDNNQYKYVVKRNTEGVVELGSETALTGLVTEQEQTVIIHYLPKLGKAVKVRYIDATSSEGLRREHVVKAEGTHIGTPYSVNAVEEITDNNGKVYALVKTPEGAPDLTDSAALTGRVSEQEQVVVFKYQPKVGKSVKVRYEKVNGDLLKETELKAEGLQVGDKFNAVAEPTLVVDGTTYYNPRIKTGLSAEGSVTEEEQVIVFVYDEVTDKSALEAEIAKDPTVRQDVKFINATEEKREAYISALGAAKFIAKRTNPSKEDVAEVLAELVKAASELDGVEKVTPAKTITNNENSVENVVFADELTLKVEAVDATQIKAFEGKDVALYDISFVTATNQSVNIGTGDYTVRLARDVAKQVEKVVHLNDKLQVEEIPSFTLTDTHVVFKTTHFSIYGIVYKTEDKQTTQPASTEVKPESQPSTETGQITKVETQNTAKTNTVENVKTSDSNNVMYIVMVLLSAVTLLFFKKKVD